MGAAPIQHASPDPSHEGVSQRRLGAQRELGQDRFHRLEDILTRSLGGFDVDVHPTVVADIASIQRLLQGQKHRGLASLARRVKDKAALAAKEAQYPFEIDTV